MLSIIVRIPILNSQCIYFVQSKMIRNAHRLLNSMAVHPGPLPLGEGAPNFECAFAPLNRRVPLTRPPTTLSPSDGEREGVRGSWTAFIFLKRIGTMNQIGTPLPALSPQGGERVAEGRVRGVHGQGEPFGRAWVMQAFRVVQPALFRLSTRSAEGGGRSLLRFSDAGGASP